MTCYTSSGTLNPTHSLTLSTFCLSHSTFAPKFPLASPSRKQARLTWKLFNHQRPLHRKPRKWNREHVPYFHAYTPHTHITRTYLYPAKFTVRVKNLVLRHVGRPFSCKKWYNPRVICAKIRYVRTYMQQKKPGRRTFHWWLLEQRSWEIHSWFSETLRQSSCLTDLHTSSSLLTAGPRRHHVISHHTREYYSIKQNITQCIQTVSSVWWQ